MENSNLARDHLANERTFLAWIRTAAAIVVFGFAIGLFVERARSCTESLAFGDDDVTPVIQICRQLDGLPLALELAAARIPNFGFAGLAKRLDDRFSVLNKGRRTAMPRQKTLRATLDWSFELLTSRERVLLTHCGIFADTFTLETAAAVCLEPGDGGHPLTQAGATKSGQPATALGPEDDDVGTPATGGLGDAIGDGETVSEIVDAVSRDPLVAEAAYCIVNDRHAFEFGLGCETASAYEELVDVDDPDG